MIKVCQKFWSLLYQNPRPKWPTNTACSFTIVWNHLQYRRWNQKAKKTPFPPYEMLPPPPPTSSSLPARPRRLQPRLPSYVQRARCHRNTINWDVAQASDISSDCIEEQETAMLAKVINCRWLTCVECQKIVKSWKMEGHHRFSAVESRLIVWHHRIIGSNFSWFS